MTGIRTRLYRSVHGQKYFNISGDVFFMSSSSNSSLRLSTQFVFHHLLFLVVLLASSAFFLSGPTTTTTTLGYVSMFIKMDNNWVNVSRVTH